MANLPQGLATQLGHDGLTLSAGERQRVALARALLRPAPILLLDEPTAALDPPTVARIAPAIEPWLGGAHRRGGGPRTHPAPLVRPGGRPPGPRLRAGGLVRRGSLRRILSEPGTPYGRLALAGLLGLASAAATIGLLAGSGYVVGRAALRPGLGALVGILAVVEVLAFLRGPLRYGERLVGHDAALRALTRWRVWLYDCLTPRVPAALAGWRSGDLLTRAIDDVDTLQDLYLRTVLPVAVAVGAAALGTVAVGLILPVGRARARPPAGRRAGGPRLARPGAGAATTRSPRWPGRSRPRWWTRWRARPSCWPSGPTRRRWPPLRRPPARADALERRHAALATAAGLVIALCQAVALCTVLALGVAAVHDHTLGQVMVAVLPLAALATFETVPGVPLAVARSLAVRAAADRLFALEAVAIPVDDPPCPAALGAAVPDVTFAGASLRYADTLPRALDGISLSLPAGHTLAVTGSSGAGKSSLVNALLRFWPLERGTLAVDGTDVAQLRQGDVRGRLRAGRPTGAALRRNAAGQPHPGPARRQRRRHRRRAARRPARPLRGLAPRRSRHARRRRRRRALGRRAAPPGRGPRPAGARTRAAARRADERARRRAGRRRPRRRVGRGGPRRPQRAGHHPPGRRGGALRRAR